MLATLPYVKSGKLKLIAITSAKRNAALPDAPTFAESGVPDFVTGSWQGILAPGKTPPEIVARLQAETHRILFTPDIKEKLAGQGADPMGTTPAETAEFMAVRNDLAAAAAALPLDLYRPALRAHMARKENHRAALRAMLQHGTGTPL